MAIRDPVCNVLAVDDEPQILTTIEDLLEEDYDVLGCAVYGFVGGAGGGGRTHTRGKSRRILSANPSERETE